MNQEDVLVLLVVFVLGFVVSQMMSGRLVEGDEGNPSGIDILTSKFKFSNLTPDDTDTNLMACLTPNGVKKFPCDISDDSDNKLVTINMNTGDKVDRTEVMRNENNIVISLCVSKFSNYCFILNNNFRVFRIGKKYTHCSEFIEKRKERNRCFYRMKLNEDDNSKFLLHGNLEGKIFVRSQKSGKILKQFYDHLSEVTEITLNQRFKSLVSCGKDGSVVIRKVNFLDSN